MRAKIYLALSLTCAALTSGVAPAAQPAADEILRKAFQAERDNWPLTYAFEFTENAENRKPDGTVESKTWRVHFIDGSPHKQLVAKDGKPLPSEEEKFERDKVEAIRKERPAETAEQRAERLEEAKKKRNETREALKEVPDAFNFKLLGEEMIRGRKAYLFEFTPKPGYKPKHKRAKIFPVMQGKIWIDAEDYHWVRADAVLTDTYSFGWILVRVGKGGRAIIDQTKVDGVWQWSKLQLDVDVRIGLVKNLQLDQTTTYTDFKRIENPVVSQAAPRKPGE